MTDVTACRATCEEAVRNPVSRGGWLLRAAAAALAGGCAALHLLAAASMPAMPGLSVLGMLAMALACLPCAVHALLGPTLRTWGTMGLVAVGMLVAHPLLGLLAAGRHPMPVPGSLAAGLVVGPVLSLGVAVAGSVTALRTR